MFVSGNWQGCRGYGNSHGYGYGIGIGDWNPISHGYSSYGNQRHESKPTTLRSPFRKFL